MTEEEIKDDNAKVESQIMIGLVAPSYMEIQVIFRNLLRRIMELESQVKELNRHSWM